MMNALAAPAERVRQAAGALGLEIDIRTMTASTRTAAEAAAALSCFVGQVVKSLVFRGHDTGRPHLLLVSGVNRVDEEGIAAHIGESLARAEPGYVREVTGFTVGGIPPLGHLSPLPTWLDRDLLKWEIVWAAAGTADTMFPIAPDRLLRATRATVVPVA